MREKAAETNSARVVWVSGSAVPRAVTVLLLAGIAALAGCVGGEMSTQGGGASWKGPQSGLIGPFKEQAFRYRQPLEIADGGRFLRLPYDEFKDINERDVVPVRKVRSWWVRRLPPDAEKELEFSSGGRQVKYKAVGRLDGNSAMTVIYVHGRGGNRHWGFDDERFGGNFNRLKNLMLQSGGVFISTDFADFEQGGFADVRRLVALYRPKTAGKLVVACGSLGNTHCWNIFQDGQTASKVDGVIVLAGFPDQRFFASEPARSAAAAIPLVISHGTADPDYSYEPMVAFYEQLRKASPGYPVRFLLFETGKHGAPIRMIDWRDTLNWIAAR